MKILFSLFVLLIISVTLISCAYQPIYVSIGDDGIDESMGAPMSRHDRRWNSG